MAKKHKKFTPNWIPERVQHKRLIDNSSFYNSFKWRKFSKNYKKNNPICVICDAKGIVSPAEVTDHIIPINKGGAKLSEKNVQSVCNQCHNSKSGTEGAGAKL